MHSRVPRIFAFGGFELDEARLELRWDGRRLPVQPKVLQLLLHLVANSQRPIATEELLEVVWQGETVTPASVKRAVQGARRVLGDTGEGQNAIRTIRGRGYQFLPILAIRSAAHVPAPINSGEGAAGISLIRPETPTSFGADSERVPFIGRAAIMAALQTKLAEALGGRGQAVLLVGEPGIGKTRVLQELSSLAATLGADAWFGRCHRSQDVPAFWPWLQILRAYSRTCGTCTGDGPNGAASALAVAFPEVAMWSRPDPSGGFFLDQRRDPAPDVDNSKNPQAASTTVPILRFDALAEFLKNAAKARPVALLFDDLHHADESSLRMFAFLVGEIDRERIFIAGTVRPPLGRSFPNVPHATWLELEGLNVHEIAEYLAVNDRQPIAANDIERIRQYTCGNPMFLRHMLHDWHSAELRPFAIEPGLRSACALSLGSHNYGLRAAAEQHLEILSESSRYALRAASTLGYDFTVTGIAQVIHRGEDLVLADISEAASAGLIREVSPGEARYRFVHPLIRDLLFELIPLLERVQIHALASEPSESAITRRTT